MVTQTHLKANKAVYKLLFTRASLQYVSMKKTNNKKCSNRFENSKTIFLFLQAQEFSVWNIHRLELIPPEFHLAERESDWLLEGLIVQIRSSNS